MSSLLCFELLSSSPALDDTSYRKTLKQVFFHISRLFFSLNIYFDHRFEVANDKL